MKERKTTISIRRNLISKEYEKFSGGTWITFTPSIPSSFCVGALSIEIKKHFPNIQRIYLVGDYSSEECFTFEPVEEDEDEN